MTAALMMAFKVVDLVLLTAQVAPAIKAKHDVRKSEIEQMVSRGEDPTAAIEAAMDEIIADLRVELHRPLPVSPSI